MLTWTILLLMGAGWAWFFRARRRKQPNRAATPAEQDFPHVVRFFNSIHRVECSWCGKVLQQGREPVSHGICPQCSKEHFNVELPSEARRP